jgi:hypothetical protein
MLNRISRVASREVKFDRSGPTELQHSIRDRSPSPRRHSGQSMMMITKKSSDYSTITINVRVNKWRLLRRELKELNRLTIVEIVNKLDSWLEMCERLTDKTGGKTVTIDYDRLNRIRSNISKLRYLEVNSIMVTINQIIEDIE